MRSLRARAAPPRWVAGVEPVVVLALIELYTWWLRGRGPAVAGIVLLVLLSHAWRRETPASLGFRRANFGRCVRAFGPVVALVAAVIVWDGVGRGGARAAAGSAEHGPTPGAIAAILVGYCLWGLVQQWALNGYFVNRFAEAFGGLRRGRQLAALAAAACFAAAHLPNWYLVGPTFVLGLLSALAYLRYRNLLFLGLAHGVLGALLVVFVARSLPQGLRTGPGAARSRPAASRPATTVDGAAGLRSVDPHVLHARAPAA